MKTNLTEEQKAIIYKIVSAQNLLDQVQEELNQIDFTGFIPMALTQVNGAIDYLEDSIEMVVDAGTVDPYKEETE